MARDLLAQLVCSFAAPKGSGHLVSRVVFFSTARKARPRVWLVGLRCWGINRREQTRSKTEGGRSDCGLRQPVRLCACTQVCNPNQAVEDRQRSFGPGAPFGHCSISVQAPVCRLLRNRLRATPALVLRVSVRITDGSVASPPSANARV